MNIVIDYREKDLYLLLNKLNTNLTFTISSQNIELGDIQFHLNELCCLIIERKTVADFAASIQDGRYREQAHRLSASNVHNHQIFYLIEGNIFNFKSKYSRITSTTMYSALLTTSLFKGFSIWNTQSLQETCTIIIQWANKIHKEQTKLPYYNNINHNDLKTDKYIECIKITKKSKTNDNIGEIMLMQIPGISASISLQLLNPFNGNIYHFLKKIAEDNNYLETIKIKSKKGSERKLGKNIIESIRKIIL
tara:strand:- start:7680 stop:8429 length:750 start_codon:yes stop_codon:yes gene_type:complete